MEGENHKQLNIELPDEIAQGSYANLAIVTHSSNEFLIDFLRMLPGMSRPRVVNRIIMAPESAKRLLGVLQENIRKYEADFGEISLNNEPINNIPMGLGTNAEA